MCNLIYAMVSIRKNVTSLEKSKYFVCNKYKYSKHYFERLIKFLVINISNFVYSSSKKIQQVLVSLMLSVTTFNLIK